METLFGGYLLCAGVCFFLSIAMGMYEQWFVWRRDGKWLHSADDWVQNVMTSAFIAIIPGYNIIGIMFTIGYFAIEHAPYIWRKS